MAAVTICSDFGAQKIDSVTVSIVSPFICHEVMGLYAMILVFFFFYDDLQDLLELTPPKRWAFHHGGLECKSKKSRDTWGNRKIWPWSTKWGRAKANRVLPREHTGHRKHPLPTTQDSTHGNHQMVNTEIRLIIFAAKDGEALYSQ